jgi:uncharacterized protein YoxC
MLDMLFGFCGMLFQADSVFVLTPEELQRIVSEVANASSATSLEVATQIITIGVALGLIPVGGFLVKYLRDVSRRMASGDKRFMSIEHNVDTITKDLTRNERLHEQFSTATRKFDLRLTETSVAVAEVRSDVKHLTRQMHMFMDTKSRRGFTAKLREAMREVSAHTEKVKPPSPADDDEHQDDEHQSHMFDNTGDDMDRDAAKPAGDSDSGSEEELKDNEWHPLPELKRKHQRRRKERPDDA